MSGNQPYSLQFLLKILIAFIVKHRAAEIMFHRTKTLIVLRPLKLGESVNDFECFFFDLRANKQENQRKKIKRKEETTELKREKKN